MISLCTLLGSILTVTLALAACGPMVAQTPHQSAEAAAAQNAERTTTAQSTARSDDVPAVIVNPTEASRAELARAVSAALHGAQITLADDALTTTSVLVIERARPRDANGRLMQGRELGRPERFQLVRSGGQCVLVHEGSGLRSLLTATDCVPQ